MNAKFLGSFICVFALCISTNAQDASNQFTNAGQSAWDSYEALIDGTGSIDAFDAALDTFLMSIAAIEAADDIDAEFATATASFYAGTALFEAYINYQYCVSNSLDTTYTLKALDSAWTTYQSFMNKF